MTTGRSGSGNSGGGTAKTPFRDRFHAWWEGYELARGGGKAAKPAAKPAAREHIPPTIAAWPEPRRLLIQELFGEGMTTPGGITAITHMIKPLGLNEKHTVVEIGTGLGGIARLVAKETGAYVFAFEADGDLVTAGTELSHKAGLAKKAQIRKMPAGDFEARPRSVDAIIAKEALIYVPDKKEVFAAMRKALKPGGQITLTDYLLVGDLGEPAVRQWQEGEPVPPNLLTPAGIRAMLEEIDLEVRVLEDFTEEYCTAALASFADYAHRLRQAAQSPDGVDEERSAWLLSEGALWSRRTAALQSGAVKLYRLYARLPGMKELT